MSTPYPPAPKKLLRNPATKMIGGVCSGVADYLNMDVTLVRILTVVISLFTGVPVILYVVALFVVPEAGAPTAPPPYPGVTPPPADPVWGSSGAPWEQRTAPPVNPERTSDS